MIYSLIFFFTYSLNLFAEDRCSTFDDPAWKLSWHDEFNSTKLDLSKWEITRALTNFNSELQVYSGRYKNIFIEDGVLHLKAHKERNYFGREYSSGRIETYPKQAFLYGRFEFCAKLPKGRGYWPAAWMMPETSEYGHWPMSGEIDIVENIGHVSESNWGTIHYGLPWPHNQMTGATYTLSGSDFSEDFHSFALEWEPEVMRWYVDGNLYSVKTPADLGGHRWVFDKPFYIILNLAVGGLWPGYPDEETAFPQSFQVDYVRVYSRQ